MEKNSLPHGLIRKELNLTIFFLILIHVKHILNSSLLDIRYFIFFHQYAEDNNRYGCQFTPAPGYQTRDFVIAMQALYLTTTGTTFNSLTDDKIIQISEK